MALERMSPERKRARARQHERMRFEVIEMRLEILRLTDRADRLIELLSPCEGRIVPMTGSAGEPGNPGESGETGE